MHDWLSVSRAARLAGVSRAELQRRIRHGELSTFEGQVATADLLRLYPRVQMDHDELYERLEQLKTAAVFGPRAEETRLPEAPVLVARLRALSEALAQRITALTALDDFCDQVRARLVALSEVLPAAPLQEVVDWFDHQRQSLARPAVIEPRWLAREHFLRIVAASVKVIPSGREFLVEGNESLLSAALRAGLRLDHGCARGHCGACKVRLVRGEVWKIAEHDDLLSERERQAGYLLACCHTAVTDLVLEVAEARAVNELPQREIDAQLRRCQPLTPTLWQLEVQTPRTHTLRFLAGQRVILTLAGGAARELPIASCPCDGHYLRFLVWGHDDDFTQALAAHPLGPVTVTGPYGTFVLDEVCADPLLLIAGDGGIAALQSVLDQAVAIDAAIALRLYWATDPLTWDSQAHWCRALTDALDHFAAARFDPEDECALLAAVRADLTQWSAPPQVYVAGPAAWVARLVPALLALGIAPARLAVDRSDVSVVTPPGAAC